MCFFNSFDKYNNVGKLTKIEKITEKTVRIPDLISGSIIIYVQENMNYIAKKKSLDIKIYTYYIQSCFFRVI